MPLTGEAKLAYQRQYQKDNRQRLLTAKQVRWAEQKAFIRQAKTRPCTDCGIQYPYYVMEFDHVQGDKKYDLSRLGKLQASWKTIEAEIAKCQVVCSNCHRERTAQRMATASGV